MKKKNKRKYIKNVVYFLRKYDDIYNDKVLILKMMNRILLYFNSVS